MINVAWIRARLQGRAGVHTVEGHSPANGGAYPGVAVPNSTRADRKVTGDIPRDTMTAAAGAGSPQITLPTGKTIQGGEEGWRVFITYAPDVDCVLAHAAVLVFRNTALTEWVLRA